jgi:hypothetical protein
MSDPKDNDLYKIKADQFPQQHTTNDEETTQDTPEQAASNSGDDELSPEEQQRLNEINAKIDELFEEGGELHLQQKQQEAERKLQEERKQQEAKKQQQQMGNFSDPYASRSGGVKKKKRDKTSPEVSLNSKKLQELKESTFLGQSISLSDYIFLPKGLEFPLLIIYFSLIPYGMGLLILFLFVADQNMGSFLKFDIFTVIPVWSIGYEATAAFIMAFIIKSAVTFKYRKEKDIKKLEAEIRKKMKRMETSRSKYG